MDSPETAKARDTARDDLAKFRKAVIHLLVAVAATEAERDLLHLEGMQCWVDKL